MAEAVTLPKQGQSVESCIITQWLKKPGEEVKEGEILYSYETDKAAFDEEAKISGTLLEIFFNEGDEVPVLTNVAVIGNPGEPVDEFRPGAPGKKESVPAEKVTVSMEHETVAEAPAQQVITSGERIRISPRARIMARDKNIDTTHVHGSGPNGRIIVRDIEKYLSQPQTGESTRVSEVKVSGDDFSIKPVSNIRKIIAENMERSLKNSAQLTHHLTADARRLQSFRKEVKAAMARGSNDDITLNDMVCYCVIRALKKHPDMNVHFLGSQIRSYHKVHLGIAVDTDRGLMVPVLRNADDYSISGLSSRIKELATNCRNNRIDPGLLQGETGSFTVSNLGVYGIEMFTPVLNIPQAGILGVNTITRQPRDTGDGVIAFVPVIGLSLTYDHRAIDGAPASRFLAEVKNEIENFNQTV